MARLFGLWMTCGACLGTAWSQSLLLDPQSACFHAAAPNYIVIEIWMHDIPVQVEGGQYFLTYDNTKLDFVAADPAPTVFTREIRETVDEAAGTIDYATGVPDGPPSGVSGTHALAVLTFQLPPGVYELCGVSGLVGWRPHIPPTRLTTTTEPVEVPTVDLGSVTVDNTPPTIACPADVTVNADAGTCQATNVNLGIPSGVGDNCGAVSVTNNAPGLYATGDTTVIWTATDACGNAAQCAQTVTVRPFNDFAALVQLQGEMVTDVTRCVTFAFVDCPGGTPVVFEREMTFIVQPDGTALAEAVFNDLPCSASAYTCVTAQDRLHTLQVRLNSPLGLRIDAGQYVAEFTGPHLLHQADLYDDNLIDIIDFGVFVGQWGTNPGLHTDCSTPAPHADIDGDNAVDATEFAFLSGNFLLIGAGDCCLRAAAAPRTHIATRELLRLGLAPAAQADLNGDGVVDLTDVALFAGGVRPRPHPGPRHGLGPNRLARGSAWF